MEQCQSSNFCKDAMGSSSFGVLPSTSNRAHYHWSIAATNVNGSNGETDAEAMENNSVWHSKNQCTNNVKVSTTMNSKVLLLPSEWIHSFEMSKNHKFISRHKLEVNHPPFCTEWLSNVFNVSFIELTL
jgi:hypothetical protein